MTSGEANGSIRKDVAGARRGRTEIGSRSSSPCVQNSTNLIGLSSKSPCSFFRCLVFFGNAGSPARRLVLEPGRADQARTLADPGGRNASIEIARAHLSYRISTDPAHDPEHRRNCAARSNPPSRTMIPVILSFLRKQEVVSNMPARCWLRTACPRLPSASARPWAPSADRF
jgi:hypothetical protein